MIHGWRSCKKLPPGRAMALETIAHPTASGGLTELSEPAGAESPAVLARHMGLLFDGALTSGRLLQVRAVVEEARSAARRLVADHT
ncbi:hypothetical protein [Streptomyces nigra]|uniref:hypothetical protein n=1 Tax=Streptomyces nigra TaxID=1827580 RepID=UPI00368B527C